MQEEAGPVSKLSRPVTLLFPVSQLVPFVDTAGPPCYGIL